MAVYEFRMPSLGADMDEGTLVEWRVKPGDTVAKGNIILHIETEKAAFDAETFHDGTVVELAAKEGDRVKVGSLLAKIETTEEVSTLVRSEGEQGAVAPPTAIPITDKVIAPRVRAATATRRLANELEVDLKTLEGSGKQGEITAEDVRAAAAKKPKQTKHETMARVTARLMARSKREIPHYYLETTIVLSEVLQRLEVYNNTKVPEERILRARYCSRR